MKRVFNSLLDETSILGTAIGFAHNGFVPMPEIQFLAYGRGLDTRRMREVLGFEPAYTTRAAFQDYAQGVGSAIPGAAVVGAAVTGAAGSAASAISHVWAAGRND